MLELRDYQQSIIYHTRQSMSFGHTKPLICLPTGAGKTVCFAWMADQSQRKNKTVWFLVHRRELLDQTVDTFDRFNIPRDRIYIGMVATVANHPEKLPKPDLIILDEAHHASATTWLKIIDAFPDAYLIGLTATPCRLDGKPLGKIFDDLILGVTTANLIDQGFLSRYRYFAPSITDLSGLKRKGSDFDQEQAAEMLMTKAIYGDVLHHWHQYANDLQTIVYCSSVKHSQEIAEAFRADGIEAVHFDGNTPAAERKQIVADFRKGQIKVMCNVNIVTEGFDMSGVDCCLLLRPTMSLVIHLQQLGRALRPAPGKVAILIDCVGNYVRNGLPDDRRNWNINESIEKPPAYDEKGKLLVKQCLQCFYTFPSGPSVCPNCGAEVKLTREEIKNIKDIELEEIKQTRRDDAIKKVEKSMDMSECRTLQEFQAYAKLKGYKPGFAYVMWQNKIKKGNKKRE